MGPQAGKPTLESLLLTCGADGVARLWDLRASGSAQRVFRPSAAPDQHTFRSKAAADEIEVILKAPTFAKRGP